MADGDRQSDTDEAHRAIGRYVSEFSRLIFWLRWQTAAMSSAEVPPDARPQHLFSNLLLHTGEMNASPLRDLFFAVADEMSSYTPDEAQMARRLSVELAPFIETRNDLLHGEWMIGWFSSTGVEVDGEVQQVVRQLPPTLHRTKTGRKSGRVGSQELEPHDLDAATASLIALRKLIAEWGNIAARTSKAILDGPNEPRSVAATVRHSDVFVLRDGQVLRQGPLAAQVAVTVD